MESDSLKALFSSYYEMAKTCAGEVVKRFEGEEQEALLKQLEEAVKHVSDAQNITYQEANALNAVEMEFNKSDISELDDLTQILEEKIAQTKSTLQFTQGLKDYQSHVKKAFDNLELEDMIVASSESNIDPYTKKPIKNPVKTKYCNHTFEKTSVLELLSARGKNGKLRCPYMGCQKSFTAQDLIDVSEENGVKDESD